MLCLFQCQSNSAFTRTYWSSRGTAGRNSRFKLFLLLILGAFSFVLSAILNSQASYRCTLVPRLPFPVPRSPFPVPRSPFPVPRSPFPVLVTSHVERWTKMSPMHVTLKAGVISRKRSNPVIFCLFLMVMATQIVIGYTYLVTNGSSSCIFYF